MQNKITEILDNNLAITTALKELSSDIGKAASLIINAYGEKGKILLFGNGGSAADAQHIAAELVVRFNNERKSLPAIALTTNSSIITASANDYGYDNVFDRQIESLADPKDVIIAISTSGTSKSVINGVSKAKEKGCKILVLTGGAQTGLNDKADVSLAVSSDNTARIQEAHITIGHIICQLVEDAHLNE